MSQTPRALPAASGSSSNFQSTFETALNQYKNKTKNDLVAHQLTAHLESCSSPGAILAALNEQYGVKEFIQSQRDDERHKQWLSSTANVLYAFSATIGQGVGLVFSPASVIFAGVGVLLTAAKDVDASQDAMVDLFERIENFFRRLETYTEVTPTHAMMDLIVKIIVEVLGILAIATKEVKQRSAKKYLKKLLGRTDIEDALTRLDKLTHDEALMATAQVLKLAHTVDDKVTNIGGKVTGIDDNVKAVIDGGKEARVTAREGNAIMRQTAHDIDEIMRSQLRESVWGWLSPPDPSTNHNIARSARHKGTATWFFQGSIFTEWKSDGPLLWIHGKPGSGKSILCSTIIQDIESICEAGQASLGYFYFDFRDTNKQHCRDLVRSLLTQLSTRSNPRCDILSRLYEAHDRGKKQPSEAALLRCLEEMLTLPDQYPVYIVIDALDECPNTSGLPSPREQVLDLLKKLVNLSLPNFHLCITSRPEIDIRHALEPLTLRRVSLHEQSGQKKDIIDYVTSVVQSDPKMRRWRDEDKNLVIETLSERVDGMFRWIFCQLEVLRYCFPPSVRQILEDLPETLDETYERILRDINRANRGHAHRLLQCLTVAVRPLHVAELAEVLAVDFGTNACGGSAKLNTDWRWDDQQQAVLSTCSSLISILDDDGSQLVQFSHFSVKEFLTSSRFAGSSTDVSRFHILLEPAHTILAKACLGVLLRLDEHADTHNVDSSFPLARYAAEHWVDHAQIEQVSSHMLEAMVDLFDPSKPCFAAWLRVVDTDVNHHTSPLYWFTVTGSERLAASPLYYAALHGFYDLAEHLIIKHPQQVNANGGHYVSPLAATLRTKRFDIAQLLYEHGADIDVRGYNRRTPLCACPLYGHREIVEWLLGHGADPNSHDSGDLTALHVAASYGQVEISQILLQHKADQNAPDRNGLTPLHRASEDGCINVARLLLKHGVDVNAQDNNLSTALHVASRKSKVDIICLLLEHGADVEAEDDKGRTPLQVASGQRHDEITKLLLEHRTIE